MNEDKKVPKLPEAILSFRIVEVITDRDNRLSKLADPVPEKEKDKQWPQP